MLLFVAAIYGTRTLEVRWFPRGTPCILVKIPLLKRRWRFYEEGQVRNYRSQECESLYCLSFRKFYISEFFSPKNLLEYLSKIFFIKKHSCITKWTETLRKIIFDPWEQRRKVSESLFLFTNTFRIEAVNLGPFEYTFPTCFRIKSYASVQHMLCNDCPLHR